MTTLKDIAIKTGVSVRTVSRALKNVGYINAEKKKEILKVAKDLDYRINLMAQSIRTKKNFIIELIFPIRGQYNYNMPKVEAFEYMMRKNGYRVSLFLHRFQEDSSMDEIENILSQNPSGVALFDFPGIDQLLKKFNSYKIPYIVLGRADKKVDHVEMDRAQGILKGLNHLYEKNKKVIAYLGDENPIGYFGKIRLKTYMEFIQEKRLDPYIINVPTSKNNYETSFQVGSTISLDSLPDGVFAYTDLVALGFMQALQKRGVEIPERVSIVGFNDTQVGNYFRPKLTTIAHPNDAIGKKAAEILLAKINKEECPPGGWSQELPGELIIRKST